MTDVQTGLETVVKKPVCQECEHDTMSGRTMYVHLCSGQVTEISGVTQVRVTDSQIVMERGEQTAVAFPRRDVYFACCNPDQQPGILS